ncbi:MAG: hypothetical protein KC442_03850 [Thermomicrobiales bacterium]|nr:hypothetical protein [Thermomicrobiales bacterium]
MSPRGEAVRRVAVVVGAVLLLGLGWDLWHTANQQLGLRFVVPDGYAGYLVPRWECSGGVELQRNALGGFRDQVVTFDADGAACFGEPIPGHGFRVLGYEDAQGNALPVIQGGTRALEMVTETGTGPERFVFSPIASLGVGNGQILGDECALRDFLETEFGVPERAVTCDPIYTLPNPALSATPGLPAGPEG